ncbi:hypothetical protein GWI33_019861 [Rhynchophorus ferrugineus]|uniref:Platelet-derived growth factor (PDGF) family profile domain-containing protein n=1 Tax=Rhynchophorus ferrugineus TaxID=354439 RepID=A0A834M0Z4_RHYFE|nr:hypothetical protein GWI33_019861 [Rhynchophorus ferrugineus]
MDFLSVALSLSVISVVAGRCIDYREVNEISEAFPCRVPQPRAISVPEITGKELIMYNPAYVVLHRCGGSGCCPNSNETCEPEDTEIVNLMVSYVNDDVMENVTIEATNHTSCACVQSNGTIK